MNCNEKLQVILHENMLPIKWKLEEEETIIFE